ncbi:hypothetical protein K431DRAFT_86008 [Polychaeton citri CBS 116435]|uniref:Uncharacterized protein n=1 Tax=Polychaeton citri CBS 116435 TaxID=1314669 RepID=A0A9P4Q7L1_9PEZI|nr:hypothetical protein K431DRAFT_86008 [Polychaeton citri CBS 116435]
MRMRPSHRLLHAIIVLAIVAVVVVVVAAAAAARASTCCPYRYMRGLSREKRLWRLQRGCLHFNRRKINNVGFDNGDGQDERQRAAATAEAATCRSMRRRRRRRLLHLMV